MTHRIYMIKKDKLIPSALYAMRIKKSVMWIGVGCYYSVRYWRTKDGLRFNFDGKKYIYK